MRAWMQERGFPLSPSINRCSKKDIRGKSCCQEELSKALYASCPVCSVGGVRRHRQAEESREHQQLQLQGGQGGICCIYYLSMMTEL